MWGVIGAAPAIDNGETSLLAFGILLVDAELRGSPCR
jgi:hypothetical protein